MHKIRHKFNAQPTTVDNKRFASKLEARYYHMLKNEMKTGKVLFFLQQVPFHLQSGIKYIVDFQVFYSDGTIAFIDTKGVETQTFLMKKKLVENEYPIKISIVKKI